MLFPIRQPGDRKVFKLKKWQIAGFALFIIGTPAMFMYFDATCSPISNRFCAQWIEFQWETVLAGLLGLSGGLYVVASTRAQITAQREDMAVEKLYKIDTLINHIIESQKEIKSFINNEEAAIKSDTTGVYKIVGNRWNMIRKNAKCTNETSAVLNQSDLPVWLRQKARFAGGIHSATGLIEFTTDAPATETINQIKRMLDRSDQALSELTNARGIHKNKLMQR